MEVCIIVAMTRKVLISPGYGAGWSTWNSEFREDFLFDEKLIDYLEMGGTKLGDEDNPDDPLGDFKARLVEKYKDTDQAEAAEYVYLGGACDLTVVEVEGQFLVEEYDGSEGITRRDDNIWI